uniref:PilZ domain-containing protein n=1 Tax=Magnetococcus massalia (strain MO-1) TaxID=451514 RepID=A0A1S7LQS0_MAGMO|nr:Conserved hypothetical protein [Candidatus Magnetococcus massalia]
MHGVIFLALEDFASQYLDDSGWDEILRTAGLEGTTFAPDQIFENQDWEALLLATAQVMGVDRNALLERFGEHIVPGLLEMSEAMGILDPRWGPIDILENALEIMKASLRMQVPNYQAPDIRILRLRFGEIALAYFSERRMGPLMKGIAIGLGKHFNEPLDVWQPEGMGHSRFYRINVRIADEEKLRSVDMVREFNQLREEGGVATLYNTFQGVTVSNEASVVDVTPEGIQLRTFRDQLLAMRNSNEAFVALPHMVLGIHAHVQKLEINKELVILDRMSLTDGPVGQRKSARVEPSAEIRVQMKSEGRRFHGTLDNLSVSGARCTFPRSGLNDELLFHNMKLEFLMPLSSFGDEATLANTNQYFETDGNILDVRMEEDSVVARLLFSDMSPNAKKLATLFAADRKQTLIRHISQMAV